MLAITNAKIITMAEKVIENGDIIIEHGKIKDIGKDLNIQRSSKIIDATGKIIVPGFVDAHTHLGIGEEDIGWAGRDFDETSDPITPHLRAIDAINPSDTGFRDSYLSGVTTAMITPGSANVIGGQCAVLKTYGKTIKDMIIKNPAGIKAALGENPKRDYGVKQNKSPKTRMGIAALLRETLWNTYYYKKSKENNTLVNPNLKMEAMLMVINREIPLKIHAHRADDIITALRISEEFNIDITIEHCTEGHFVVEELAEKDVPVLIGPSFGERSKNELSNKTFATAGILSKAGIKVAIISDHGVTPSKYLPIYAALCAKEGMDEYEALKAITIYPAEILGVSERVGSIEKGKDADLVIFSGHPLDIRSQVEMVFINGIQVK